MTLEYLLRSYTSNLGSNETVMQITRIDWCNAQDVSNGKVSHVTSLAIMHELLYLRIDYWLAKYSPAKVSHYVANNGFPFVEFTLDMGLIITCYLSCQDLNNATIHIIELS